MRLVIIDYGAGNVASVRNAFAKLGVKTLVSANPKEWQRADALVLPGVGAFGAAAVKLDARKKVLRGLIQKEGKPFLGICLGMQLLLDESEESPGARGLGVIPGRVRRFQGKLPVPQTGWNLVEPTRLAGDGNPLFDGMGKFYAYFVHSYYCAPADRSVVSANTEYGRRFASAFCQGNLYATQFHPEKSGPDGLRLLQNFVREAKK